MIHPVNNIDTVDSHNRYKLHRLLHRILQICMHFYVSDAVTCWSTHLKLLMTYYVPHNSLHLHIKFSANFNVIVEASSCKLSHSPLPLLTLWHGHIYSKISDSNCSAQTKDWPKPPEGTEKLKIKAKIEFSITKNTTLQLFVGHETLSHQVQRNSNGMNFTEWRFGGHY